MLNRSNEHRRLAAAAFALALVSILAGGAAGQEAAAPTVRVAYPNLSTQAAALVPPTVTFGLQAADADGADGLPVKYRYLFKRAAVAGTSGEIVIRTPADYAAHVAELIVLDDPAWSAWQDLPADPAEVALVFSGLADDFYVLALQVLDADGAVSTGRGYQLEVAHVQVREGYFRPAVVLAETYLGISTSAFLGFDIAATQPLNFSWTASAAAYNGTIVSYRYGWDLVDVNDPNDPGWAVPPGDDLYAPERVFYEGLHMFFLRVEDNIGQVAVLQRQLRVIPFVDPQFQSPLLLIDQTVDVVDNSWLAADGTPLSNEAYRNAWWHFLAEGSGGVADFDWDRDRFDHTELVTYADLVAYRAVLCYAKANVQQLMFGVLRPVNGVDRYNWLAPYQARGGNLMLVGERSMESVLEALPNYMTPLVFDTREESYVVGPDTYVVGFGTKSLPDGSEVTRGVTMYPYATAGLATLDWTAANSKYIYARPYETMAQQRKVDCVGLKALVLDGAFRSHWAVGVADIADTIATEATIDWRDAFYAAADTLELIHNTFPFRQDEFVDANISARTTPWQPQQCADANAPGGYCVEPMLRGQARFDFVREYKWAKGETEWPANVYAPAELENLCGEMALEAYGDLPLGSARTNGQVYGWLSYKNTQDKPSGAPDVYWGFDPYRFDHEQSRKAVRWVLDRVFGLNINP